MPKTIIPGRPFTPTVYRVECPACSGVYEFEEHECWHTQANSWDNTIVLLFTCPDCKSTLNVRAKQTKQMLIECENG
jgi:uncharacterized protein YlaI